MPPIPTQTEPVLEVKNLHVRFFLDEGVVRAVDDVSLTLPPGGSLGVVGESGCGKSVTARSIMRLESGAGKVTGGEILFRRAGQTIDIATLSPTGAQIREIRGNDIAMIFQEPMAAFSPVFTVGRQIGEAARVHREMTKKQAHARAIELLGEVGIPQPRRAVDRYPFELSGGLRQRAMIAMALSCEPTVLIADEPTTALDVTIQAQILALLKRVQEETGMALLMISHNMGVIAETTDEVAVMYLGRVVEEAPAWELFERPQHPYTKALLSSIPLVEERAPGRLTSIKGNVPNPYAFPSGCRFHPRCDQFQAGWCDIEDPGLYDVAANHRAACLLLERNEAKL